MKHWFFWYIWRPGDTAWTILRPQYLTDDEAFDLEFQTKHSQIGTEMYRMVYEPRISPTWIFDQRNERELLAGAPVRAPAVA
jgi:hypothetical protein